MLLKPNLFLVGAPKCGTSAMACNLAQHPQMCMCKIKEPNYFCKDLDVQGCQTEEEFLSLFSPMPTTKIIAEGSVLYLSSLVTASAIRRFSPEARIIIMLRSPIDVMYAWHSQMLFTCNEFIADFKEALAAEPHRKNGSRLSQVGTKRNCPQLLFYRDIVRFAEQMRRFIDEFGQERIHVILHDDFRADPEATYVAVLRFLEIDETFRPDFVAINRNRVRRSWQLHYWTKKLLARPAKAMLSETRRLKLIKLLDRFNAREVARAPMDKALRRQLQTEILPEVEELSELLGRDCTHWCKRGS